MAPRLVPSHSDRQAEPDTFELPKEGGHPRRHREGGPPCCCCCRCCCHRRACPFPLPDARPTPAPWLVRPWLVPHARASSQPCLSRLAPPQPTALAATAVTAALASPVAASAVAAAARDAASALLAGAFAAAPVTATVALAAALPSGAAGAAAPHPCGTVAPFSAAGARTSGHLLPLRRLH